MRVTLGAPPDMTTREHDRHVAWLRGINVGGKNSLPMATLVELCAAAGATDVRTYIQSGNVVARIPPRKLTRFATTLEAAIVDAVGFEAPVILRSVAALQAAVRDNPYLARGVSADQLHLGFVRDRPTAARVAALDHDRSPPDAFTVKGDHVYLHLPNGVGRSKLTNAYFDRALGTITTVRNWRTVLAVLELARRD